METETQYNTPIFKDEEPELEIDWHTPKYQLMHIDNEERMETYEALGTGNNGLDYSGIAYFICGELDCIEDINHIQ